MSPSPAGPAGIDSLVIELKANGLDSDHETICYPDSPSYAEETKVWGAQRNLKPRIVLRPATLEDVRLITKLLFNSTLDFVVRNGSVGSASSKDVVVSLTRLHNVRFDENTETTTVDAGALWAHVDKHMAGQAPGWAVVCSRTPFVGVAGITLIGGLSWLSHEYGLISDPANLLDVEMVLGDGRVLWASNEPELLWAVRGGRCAFGVITKLKLRARRYKTTGIHFGRVTYPLERLPEVSSGVAKHLANNHDPKISFHVFVLNPDSALFNSAPGIAIMPFDARGTGHARTSEGFKWATAIRGAIEETSEMSLYEVNRHTEHARPMMGKYSTHDATGLLPEVDDELLVRANHWFQRVLKTDEAFAAGSYCLFEPTQEAAFGSTKDPGATAWPHSSRRHVLQLGVGYSPEHGHLKELALQLLKAGFEEIPKSPLSKGDFKPTFMEPSIMDIRQMYGSNFDRLERIADRWDPQRRFRTLFNPDPNFA